MERLLSQKLVRGLRLLGNKSPGIYFIENTVSKRVYVGSSCWVGFRVKSHLRHLQRGIHHCAPLQNSWNIHGPAAFRVCLWETVADEPLRIAREQFWIDYFEWHRFNLNPVAAPGNHTPMSNKARAALLKCSKRQKTAEHVEKVRQANLGQKRTPEQRQRMSESRKRVCQRPEVRAALSRRAVKQFADPAVRIAMSEQRKGQIVTQAHRQAISRALKCRPKPLGFGAKIAKANIKRRAHLSLHPWLN